MQKEEALSRERLNRGSPWGAGGGDDALMRASVGDIQQKPPKTTAKGPTAAEIAKEEAGMSEAEKRLRRKERDMEAKLKAKEEELEQKYS
jgi:flagellar capping protein FliD